MAKELQTHTHNTNVEMVMFDIPLSLRNSGNKVTCDLLVVKWNEGMTVGVVRV